MHNAGSVRTLKSVWAEVDPETQHGVVITEDVVEAGAVFRDFHPRRLSIGGNVRIEAAPVIVVDHLFRVFRQLTRIRQGDQANTASLVVRVECTSGGWHPLRAARDCISADAFVVGDDKLLVRGVIGNGGREVGGRNIADDLIVERVCQINHCDGVCLTERNIGGTAVDDRDSVWSGTEGTVARRSFVAVPISIAVVIVFAALVVARERHADIDRLNDFIRIQIDDRNGVAI